MRFNQKFILVISVVAGFLAFTLTLQTLNNLKKAPNPVSVVTAVQDMEVGYVLTEQDVKLLVLPRGVDPSIFFTSVDKVAGKMLRNPVRRGNPISNFDLVDKNDNLASLIPEGYRAASVSIEIPKDSLSFFKFGNRVDVVFTVTDSYGKSTETRTIMKNVLVMNMAFDSGNNISDASKVKATVTLAIRPQGTELLSYAISRGKVDLVVRPIGDKNAQEEYLTFQDLRGETGALNGVFEKPGIEVIRGVKKDMVHT